MNIHDICVQVLRGNVNTRLNELANDNYDAIILALAGLERLSNELIIEYKHKYDLEFLIL